MCSAIKKRILKIETPKMLLEVKTLVQILFTIGSNYSASHNQKLQLVENRCSYKSR